MSDWILKRGTHERAIPDEATLLRWAEQRHLKPNDQIFNPQLQRWVEARDIQQIAHVFQTGETSPPSVSVAPAASEPVAPVARVPEWGAVSRIFAVFGGLTAIAGGIFLLRLKSAGENSMIEAMAHGIGIYCIGKGLFMVAAIANMHVAVDHIIQSLRSR